MFSGSDRRHPTASNSSLKKVKKRNSALRILNILDNVLQNFNLKNVSLDKI